MIFLIFQNFDWLSAQVERPHVEAGIPKYVLVPVLNCCFCGNQEPVQWVAVAIFPCNRSDPPEKYLALQDMARMYRLRWMGLCLCHVCRFWVSMSNTSLMTAHI